MRRSQAGHNARQRDKRGTGKQKHGQPALPGSWHLPGAARLKQTRKVRGQLGADIVHFACRNRVAHDVDHCVRVKNSLGQVNVFPLADSLEKFIQGEAFATLRGFPLQVRTNLWGEL